MGACTYESTGVYTHTCTLSLIDYSENACVFVHMHVFTMYTGSKNESGRG